MIDVHAIARFYGGTVCKGNALIPTPGHSRHDRGTAIKPEVSAPDGCLVACYNGDRNDALAVKAMLRCDGFLPEADARPREFTPADRLAFRLARQARQREQLEAEKAGAKSALVLWTGASRADPGHSYLVAKGLSPFGIRQAGPALLVPMVDASFRLWNVQRIGPDGGKRFSAGAHTGGLFWPHALHLADGRPSDGPMVIGEGFATMAAIHEATGLGVAAAMSARNLEAVARTLRQIFPARQIVIAADDDRHLSENVGLRVARKAAEAAGGLVALPVPETASGAVGVDFADIGRAEAAARIAAALSAEDRP